MSSPSLFNSDFWHQQGFHGELAPLLLYHDHFCPLVDILKSIGDKKLLLSLMIKSEEDQCTSSSVL